MGHSETREEAEIRRKLRVGVLTVTLGSYFNQL